MWSKAKTRNYKREWQRRKRAGLAGKWAFILGVHVRWHLLGGEQGADK